MPEPAKTTIAQTLGPGSLKLGKTGSETEFASKVTKAEYAPEYSLDDATPMLDGSEFQPEGTWKGKLSGTFYQDYSMAGLVAWCFAHAGETLPFIFTPKTGSGNMKVTGECVIMPVKVGGDPKKTNTSDFEFTVLGKPKMEANQ